MGMKTMLTSINAEITHRGVRIGLQAGSSCWVNFEYLGRLEFLRTAEESADPGAPELDGTAVELIGEKREQIQKEERDGDREADVERGRSEIGEDGIKP